MSDMDLRPLSKQWAHNPEPERDAVTLDHKCVLETDNIAADAYIWEKYNAVDGWLQYTGELADIDQ